MTRGIFDFITDNKAYSESEKDWYLELISSTPIWYDNYINPVLEFDTKSFITRQLNDLGDQVKSQIGRKIIYFVTTRKKLRFSIIKPPKYSLLKRYLIFYLEVGKDKRIVKIKLPTYDQKKSDLPSVEATDQTISFTDKSGHTLTHTVYDFLNNNEIDLQLSPIIHYIGYTKRPAIRPIDGNHTGLSKTLYATDPNDEDVFIYFNVFKVFSNSRNCDHGLNFTIGNSLSDEIKEDEEGRIIESALIMYFKPQANRDSKTEETILRNQLSSLSDNNNIKSVGVVMYITPGIDCFRFSSHDVEPNDCHAFTWQLSDGKCDLLGGIINPNTAPAHTDDPN